jgi:hypothetical protein
MNSATPLSLERIRLNTASRPAGAILALLARMVEDGLIHRAGRMNRSLGPADSVERRATLRALVRCEPFLNKG